MSQTPFVVLEPNARMRKLIDTAEQVNPVLDTVPMERYYRSLIQIHEMAKSYLKNKEEEKALIMLLRFVHLAARLLPKHKYYKDHRSEAKTKIESILMGIITAAEDYKHNMKLSYELDYQRAMHQLAEQKEELRRIEEEQAAAIREQQEKTSVANALLAYQMMKQKERMDKVTDEPGPSTGPATSQRSGATYLKLEEVVKKINDPRWRVIIAGDIIDKFIELAAENTTNNVETCGVLCGYAVDGRYMITHAILPPQTGSANTCNSTGEMEVFETQSKLDLLTFGWIHTHPSQSAFLSSVDLHTHYAYQMSIPEAIAIVCAPSYDHSYDFTPRVGTFSLTESGMKTIGSCQLRGFHPHEENLNGSIFDEAQHVYYTEDIESTLIDLRVEGTKM